MSSLFNRQARVATSFVCKTETSLMQPPLFVQGGLLLDMKISLIGDVPWSWKFKLLQDLMSMIQQTLHTITKVKILVFHNTQFTRSLLWYAFYRWFCVNLALHHTGVLRRENTTWMRKKWLMTTIVKRAIVNCFQSLHTHSSQRCSAGWQPGFTTQLNLKTGSYSGSGLVIPDPSAPQPPTGANPPASQPSQPILLPSLSRSSFPCLHPSHFLSRTRPNLFASHVQGQVQPWERERRAEDEEGEEIGEEKEREPPKQFNT